MDTSKIESIKATIAKLITLANDSGAHAGEAETAMERATSLMKKYNLDQAQVMMQKVKEGDSLSAVEEKATCYYNERSYDWEHVLAWGMSPIFDCKSIRLNTPRIIDGKLNQFYSMSFIGMPDDIALCLYFYDYCQNEVGLAMEKFTSKIREGNDFALGMVHRIIERLNEMYKKVKEQTSTDENCTALIVVKKDAITDFVKDKYPTLTTRNQSTRRVDANAYAQGRAAGERIILSSNRRQVK